MEQNNLQVKLAAYVLGEATEQERIEVEAALENSAELRADRARLEATIGLVQEHMGADAGPESLSPEAAAVLERAAQGHATPTGMPSMDVSTRPSLRWYQRPSLRIAASVLFAGLVWVGYQVTQPREDASPFIYDILGSDHRVARAPARSMEAMGYLGGGQSEGDLEDRLRSLGYTDGSSSQPSSVSRPVIRRQGANRKSVSAPGDLAALKMLGYLGSSAEAPEPLLRSTELAGETKDGEPDFLSDSVFESTSKKEVVGIGGGAGDKFGGRIGRYRREAAGGSPAGPGAPAPRANPQSVIHPGAIVTGSNDFFLGHGESEGDGDLRGRVEDLYGAGENTDNFWIDTDNSISGEPGTGGYGAGSFNTPVGSDGSNAFFDSGAVEGSPLPGSASEGFVLPSSTSEEQLKAMAAMGYMGGDDTLRRREVESCLNSLTPVRGEGPHAMFFRYWGDNPFEYSVLDRLSTFAADVDTASYTLARRYLLDGHLPTKAQIRTEEFVNYFDADVPAPTKDTFAIHTELAPNLFSKRGDSWMLRVVVAGKEVSRDERQPLTLTFVIDTSGSMKEDGRLELVKRSLRLLLGQLDARDSISLVAFSNEARLILPMTPANRRHLIETALAQLTPNGGTNASKGLRLGYAQAEANLAAGTTNRVVFLSDGVANLGETNQTRLTDEVARLRERGIYLNTIGVGMGNHNDAFLEQLADKGDGICNYIDDDLEARRALVENFTGAFEPIARDVKIQVEFDPAQVEAYRLLGYENRAVADRDFRNDKVDAGELNAGHEVVALYEVIRTGRSAEAPLATVRLRWKRPYTEGVASRGDEVATEGFSLVRAGDAAASFAAASPGYRKSVLVAQFAEVLRRSIHAQGDSFKNLLAESRTLERELKDEDFTELFDLLTRSRRLLVERLQRVSRWDRARDQLQRSAYLIEQTRLLEGRLDVLERSYSTVPPAADSLVRRVAWVRARLDRLEQSLDDQALSELELEADTLRARLARLLALFEEAR